MIAATEEACEQPRAQPGLTIVQALQCGLPIRRREWTRFDGRRINHDTVFGPQWITLGEKRDGLTSMRYPWIVIATGAEVTLSRDDFTATDWEVQA